MTTWIKSKIVATFLIGLIAIPLSSSFIQAQEAPTCPPCPNKYLLVSTRALDLNMQQISWPIEDFFKNTGVEFKVAGFYPLKKLVRKTFKDVMVDLGLEFSKSYYNYLRIWLDVDYIFSNGRSKNLKTHLNLLPVSMGASFIYSFTCNTSFYIGGGGTWSYLWIKNHTKFFKPRVHNYCFGGIAKAGMYCFIGDCTYLDLFVNYTYQFFSFRKHKDSYSRRVFSKDIDLSGIKLGLGVNILF